jgi:biopolymer transport protein ExbB
MPPDAFLAGAVKTLPLFAAVATNAVAEAGKLVPPSALRSGGPMFWLLLLAGAVAAAVFIERLLHYHRAQINSAEFLNGVRTVLKRDNVVEAISICDATPGPVPRLVKTAILARDRGREGVREALEEAGMIEVPRLEEKLNLLATLAQITPLMGLLGSVLGFMRVFGVMQREGPYTHSVMLAGGVWEALLCTALGMAVAIPCHAGYNYLVGRVNQIVLDMERSSTDILNLVTEKPGSKNGGP